MKSLPAGRLRLIYLDKATVAANIAGGTPKPPLLIRDYSSGAVIMAFYVQLAGASEFIYQPHEPLPPNGTYAWMQTWGEVLYQ